MEKIIKTASGQPKGVKRDDDVVDRLSHRYTVLLLVTFTLIIATHTYVSRPISCLCPSHFTKYQVKYANAYCWVRNTYKLSFDDEIPHEHETDKREFIVYYQWMPFILLGQAILFYFPIIVWRAFKAGVGCDSILEAANRLQRSVHETDRSRIKQLVTNQMHHFLTVNSSEGGFLLVGVYIFSKILLTINVCMQLYLLNLILCTSYSVYGWEFLSNVIDDERWVIPPAFPRITMCDMKIRRLGNVHPYTMVCVLPINMYTEKIYAFLWFWMVFVAFMSVLNLLVWLSRIFLKSAHVGYVLEHMQGDDDEFMREEEATRFVDEYLGQDGVFILRLIGHNCNRYTICEIAQNMLENWRARDVAPHDDQMDLEDEREESFAKKFADSSAPEYDQTYV